MIAKGSYWCFSSEPAEIKPTSRAGGSNHFECEKHDDGYYIYIYVYIYIYLKLDVAMLLGL